MDEQVLRRLVAELPPDSLAELVKDLSPAALVALRDLQVGTSDAQRADYARDPVLWTTDRLGEELWSKQSEIFHSVAENRRTAVKSCHGVGKSFVASRAVTWWLDIHPPGEAFVVSTAPSFAQVRAILWRYIGQAHRKGGLPGRVTQTEWLIDNEIVGYGRKPSDYDESGFQGIHALRVLVVLDEACGIPKSLWTAADTLITNDNCRILAIGNPDNPTAHFREVCQPGSGWNTITISAFDSPNFTGEKVSERLSQELVGQVFVDDARKNWGEDSPLYISKVLGEFPDDADDGIIPGSAVAAARQWDGTEYVLDEDEDDVQLGVDVGAGGDASVIVERRGKSVGRVWRSKHDDPELLAGEIMHAIRETGARRVRVDSIGWGWGTVGHVASMCREEGLDVDVDGVQVSQAARRSDRYENLKAEMWWELGREAIRNGNVDLRNITDQAAADLTSAKFTLTTRGKIKVESKDDVRKRLGRSPDDADALLLAFYAGSEPAKVQRPTSGWATPVHAGVPGRARI